METKERNIECQLFVCTHRRELGESCADKNALDVFKDLKKISKENPHWKGKISIAQSSCLGLCSEGIAAVLYPQKKWITQIKASDTQNIYDWIESHRPQQSSTT